MSKPDKQSKSSRTDTDSDEDNYKPHYVPKLKDPTKKRDIKQSSK
jgi:hypothetical protein